MRTHALNGMCHWGGAVLGPTQAICKGFPALGHRAGTFPMQSERMYAALKGHGAPCRLVLLPHESHGYRCARNCIPPGHNIMTLRSALYGAAINAAQNPNPC